MAADNIPISRRGAGLGYFTMSTNLAVVIGPLIALTLMQSFSYDVMFLSLTVLLLIGSIAALLIPEGKKVEATSPRSKLTWNDLFEKKGITCCFNSQFSCFFLC